MWIEGEGDKYVQDTAKIQYIMHPGGRRLVGLHYLNCCGFVGGQDVLSVAGNAMDSFTEWENWIDHARSTPTVSGRSQVLRSYLQDL